MIDCIWLTSLLNGHREGSRKYGRAETSDALATATDSIEQADAHNDWHELILIEPIASGSGQPQHDDLTQGTEAPSLGLTRPLTGAALPHSAENTGHAGRVGAVGGDQGNRRVVLIAEPNPDGHRLMYVRILAEEALEQGANVLLALAQDVDRTNSFEVHLSPLIGRVKIVVTSASLISIRQLSEQHSADLTVIPDGDRMPAELIKGRGWRGHGKLRVLILRSSPPTLTTSGIRMIVKSLTTGVCSLLRDVRMVRLVGALHNHKGSVGRILSATDPVEFCASKLEVENLRAEWRMDSTRYWFIVIGAVSARKNLSMVLDAALANKGRKPPGIVVAGTIRPTVLSELSARSELLSDARIEIRVRDQLLTNSEFDTALAAADCVVLAHSNEGPSGVFSKAVTSGTRILAAGALSLREDCAKLPDSATWVPLTIPTLAAALRECAELPRPAPRASAAVSEFTGALLS